MNEKEIKSLQKVRKEMDKELVRFAKELEELTKEINLIEFSTAVKKSNKVVKTNILPQGKSSQVIRIGKKLYKKTVSNKDKFSKKILICHADVNGAMNIIRKFINVFNINYILNKSYYN